jgi:hypothetical protein
MWVGDQAAKKVARMNAAFVRIGAALAANVRETILILGLLLVSGGLALIYLPAALIAPGLVLVWLAIPPRGQKT